MSSLSLRSVIVSVGGIVCVGCAGSDESGPTLEYEISELQDAGEVPDGVVEHPNPDSFRWNPVVVDVTEGYSRISPPTVAGIGITARWLS